MNRRIGFSRHKAQLHFYRVKIRPSFQFLIISLLSLSIMFYTGNTFNEQIYAQEISPDQPLYQNVQSNSQRWQQYKDPGTGVTLQYPSGWILQPFNTGARIPELEKGFNLISPDNSVVITIEKLYQNDVPFNFVDISMEEFASHFISLFKSRNTDSTINNLNTGSIRGASPPITTVHFSSTSRTGLGQYDVAFVGNDLILYHEAVKYSPQTQQLPVIQQILGSINYDFSWESQTLQKVNNYWSLQNDIANSYDDTLGIGIDALQETARGFAEDNAIRQQEFEEEQQCIAMKNLYC
jgi:hypothetical protein